MSNLRKDDPVYYKAAIRDLIKQAIKNGIEVYSSFPTHEELVFKGSNGDVASVNLFMIKSKLGQEHHIVQMVPEKQKMDIMDELELRKLAERLYPEAFNKDGGKE